MRAPPSFPFHVIAVVLLGCGSTPPEPACVPGESIACAGAGGCTGFQVCNAAGTAYGACDCIGPTDAGPADAGALDAETPADASLDAETPIDAFVAPDAPVDGGPITGCDPLTHAECGAGQRCAWVHLTPESGETRCVPDGALAEGAACTPRLADPGYDDCGQGLVCADGVCQPVCDLTTRASCGAGAYCVRYVGLYASGGELATVGACSQACDPLTQEPCTAGEGCYEGTNGTETTFTCIRAGTVAVGAAITGTPYANSCVPGAKPMGRPGGTVLCLPFCRPIETHSGATTGEAGEAPYRCQDVGGAASDACLFGWAFAPSPSYDPVLNQVGVCLPDGFLTYDHDMMPGTAEVPFPSCTTLSNTDTDADGTPEHEEFGCAPLPAP